MILYLVFFLCLLTIYIYQNLGRRRVIPNGLKEIPIEKGLPFIGIINKIETPLCNYLVKLSKKCGPIYCVKLGMRDVVVLNNYDYIKSALVDNGDALSGRWKSLKYMFDNRESGLCCISGQVWAEQKSFILKTLKNFGIGRSRSLEIVQDECVCMLQKLDTLDGKSCNFSNFVSIFTLNVISKFLINKRYSHGDPDYQILHDYMKTTCDQSDPVLSILLMFPVFENHKCLMAFIMWISSRKSLLDNSHNSFLKEIEEHRKNIDFDSDGENLTDRFLIKQHQMQKSSGNLESFTDWQLVINGIELLGAGYDTTSSLLVWSFMLMAIHPNIQNRVREEISDKMGNERLPTMSDKVCLDYTQAVMDEIMRISSVAPLSVFHRTLSDVNVNGYFIPEDTLVIPNIFACHVDHKVWEKPLEFYPEHFLHIADNGVYKYRPREELILFSMGKRQCLGESLARMEYFIFYISILQRFQVSLVDERAHFDIFRSNDGIIRFPEIQDLVFKRREDVYEEILA